MKWLCKFFHWYRPYRPPYHGAVFRRCANCDKTQGQTIFNEWIDVPKNIGQSKPPGTYMT